MDEENRAREADTRRKRFVEFHTQAKVIEMQVLYNMSIMDDYQSLGHESFEEFCEAPIETGGLNISRSYASQLITTYKKFVKELGVDMDRLREIGIRKLSIIRDHINEDNKEEMLSMAENLSSKNLGLKIKGVNPETCEHEYRTIKVCKKCNHREYVQS
jgi:hypothetical protein